MNWTYTNVRHQFRREAEISLNEYCVVDIVYQSHTNPAHSVDGWAVVSYEKMGDFLGLSKGAVHGIIVRMEEIGMIEVNPANPKMKRTTEAWYSNAYLDDETNAKTAGERVQKIREQLSVQKMNVQKMNEKRSENERICSESERNTKVLNTRTKNKVKGEKSPQTSFEERSENFRNKIRENKGEYSNAMLHEFFNYWTEKNENGKKMRFELEKVFDVKKRLATWHKRATERTFKPKEQQLDKPQVYVAPKNEHFAKHFSKIESLAANAAQKMRM